MSLFKNFKSVDDKLYWLKIALKQFITQDYNCYKKVKVSSKIEKIKA